MGNTWLLICYLAVISPLLAFSSLHLTVPFLRAFPQSLSSTCRAAMYGICWTKWALIKMSRKINARRGISFKQVKLRARNIKRERRKAKKGLGRWNGEFKRKACRLLHSVTGFNFMQRHLSFPCVFLYLQIWILQRRAAAVWKFAALANEHIGRPCCFVECLKHCNGEAGAGS